MIISYFYQTIFSLLLMLGASASLFAQAEDCGNGIDDDGDGLIDCYDGDCQGVAGCEDFFFNPPVPECGFMPPELEEVEVTELFQTDERTFPIDQRSGVYVGDMNGDGIPDLVSRDNNPPRLQIFSGDDGRILQSIVTPSTFPFGQMAIADVDADGLGDVFQIELTGRLARYEFGNPNAIWRTGTFVGDDNNVSTPQLADINQDGVPEVYVGDRIFNSLTGVRLIDGNASVNVGGYAGGNNSDRFPIYYDLFQPGDPRPGGGTFGDEARGMEYIAGNQVWTTRQAGTNNFQFNLASTYIGPTNNRDGMTSIADINGDGLMDIAVMDGGRVYAWDPYTQDRIGPDFDVPATNAGGRINIGDFDGDGDVELGFAGRNIYIVRNYVDNNGNADLNDGTWSDLWRKTGLDDGSQRTGSTLFDFDGNGTVEVVYSEEENLFIYDGPTGNELFRITSRAGTRTEYPLVADVNGDGTAEIIVTAQELNGPRFSGTGWITVYTSANQPWVPARQVWNQHGYNVTNVNDDLTIPQFQQNNLNPTLGQRYNNFLVQTAVGGAAEGEVIFPAPDGVIEPIIDPATGAPDIDFTNCPNSVELALSVTNTGDAPFPASTPIAFYDGDPRVASPNLFTSTTLGTTIGPGESVTLQITIDVSSAASGVPIFLSVNDPGFAPQDLPFGPEDFPLTGTAECDYSNNVSFVGNVRCGEVCDNGRDDDGDGLIDEPELTQFEDTGCPGQVLQALQGDPTGGLYSVVGGSAIGTTVDQNGVVTLGNNFSGVPVTETIRYDDGVCFEDVMVTTVDDVAPRIQCPGNQTIAVDDNCEAEVNDFTPNAQVNDNCTANGDIVITQQPVIGTNFALGANTVTLTATDASGNASNCSFIVTTEDRIPPSITCPVDASVALDQNCQYRIPDLTGEATVADNCSNAGNISLSQSPAQNQVRSGDGTSILVTLMARDEVGNVANCVYTITLEDETPPVISCPTVGDQTANNFDCTYPLQDYRGQVQRRDNCSRFDQITLAQSPAPGTPVGPGVTVITITATDAAGNVSTCTIDQRVVDRDPPQLICPPRQPAMVDPNSCENIVGDIAGAAQIMDNCGFEDLTITQDPVAGSTFTGFFQNVTVTAVDQAGNSNICVTTLLPGTPPPPMITCPADQTLVANANCAATLPDYRTGTESGCGNINVQQSPAPGTTINGETTVTLTATNEGGQPVSCTFQVNLEDNTPPTITCPATQILAVDGTCEVPLPDFTAQAATMDNCDPSLGGVTVTQMPADGAMFDINDSPVTVTLTATDAAGNVATCNFQVELLDNQPPQISCPVSPQTNVLDGNCQTTLPDFRAQTMVSSTCTMSGFTLTQMPAPGTTVTGVQVTPVTITADDGQGNTVSCTFDFETVDIVPPTIICPADVEEILDGDCEFSIPDYTGLATAMDNCSALASTPLLTVTQSPAPGTVVSGHGTVTQITLAATDAAGNTANCSFDVTLLDQDPPTLTCPADQTRSLDAGCSYVLEDLLNLADAMDNCSMVNMITLAQSPQSGTVSFTGPGTETITITATDVAGNDATCAFDVEVVDDTPPTITCLTPITLEVDANCQAVVPDLSTNVLIDDNCSANGPLMLTQSVAQNTTLTGDGTTQLVTMTVTDAAGLSASCDITLSLDDVTPPTVICPAAQDLDLNSTGCEVDLPDYASLLSITDNCATPADLIIQQMPVAGTTLMGANTVQEVIFEVSDGIGNAATCAFNVTLRDVTDPSVVCPANATLILDGNCSVPLPDFTSQATVTDDCAMQMDFILSQSPAAGTNLTFDGAQATVTITAEDGLGNSSNCSFQVTAEDQTMPSISCPADRDVEVSGDCSFEVPDFTSEATVLDNCSEAAAIMVTQSPAVATVIPQAQLNIPQTITLTATDAAGNSEVCTFEITPVDRTSPVIVCPEPQTILLDAANCEAPLDDYTSLAVVSDNCTADAAITLIQDPAPGTVFSGVLLPETTVTLSATDASGNTQTCALTVLIIDAVDPTVDCSAANVTVALDENCNGVIPDLIPELVTDDNCTPNALTLLQTPGEGAVFGGDGTTATVTFTVIDGSGNEVTCTSTVTFEDQSPPNPVTCPEDQELSVDDVCAVPLPDYRASATVLDNCRAQEEIVITQSPAPGTMVNIVDNPTVTVVLTADDGNGNTETCTFVVTLIDDQALELTCPGGQLVIASSDNCDGELLNYIGDVVAVNQCMVPAGGATFSQLPPAGTLLTLADLDVPQTVTIEAEDVNGNTSTCTFEVTLVDTLAPVLTCPAPQIRPVDDACFGSIDDFTVAAFTTIEDNCAALGELTITQSPAVGESIAGPDATQTVTVTAVDPSGNQGTCTFELTFQDTLLPTIQCPDPVRVSVDNDCTTTLGDYRNQAFSSDNCTAPDDLVLVQDPLPGTVITGHVTVQEITITTTDGSGNSDNCTFTVTAVDEMAPEIACPGDQILRPDASCMAQLDDYRNRVTASDNCAAAGEIVLTQIPAAGELLTGQGDAVVVKIIADDGNGNLDSCTFLVRLEDNLPPTIVCPDDVTIPLDAACSYDLADLTEEAVVLDNCTDATDILVTQNVGIGQTFMGDGTTIPVTLTADDGNGNTAQCVTTITLADTTSPTIVCPADQVIAVDDACTITLEDYRNAATTDNCTDPNDILVTQDIAPGTVLTGDGFVQDLTLTADDGNGNTTSCTFQITLDDQIAPTIVCPPSQEIFMDGSCTTTLPDYTGLATVEDNCNPAPATAQNNPPGRTIDNLGTQTVTLTADDGNGNTTACTFVVTVSDNTPPELVCPVISIIPGDENCTVSIADYRDSLTVSDNCGPTSTQNGMITLQQSPAPGTDLTGFGSSQDLVITATDPSGNSTTCMITVEVSDTTRPAIACPLDTTLALDGNCAALIPDYTDLAVVADNCSNTAGPGAIVVSQSPEIGTMVGDEANAITISLTATDAAGNFSTCAFSVQLIDTVPPAPTCPAARVEQLDENCSFTVPDYRNEASATDNCSQASEISFEQRPAPGEVFVDDGTIVPITIIAIDQSGNRDSCVFDLTLADGIPPVIVNCPNDTTVFVDANCAFETPDFWSATTASATDNCRPTGVTSTTATGDQITYSQSPAVGQVFTGGTTTSTVTLTADDGNGNTTSCSFTLSLRDTIAPVITVCPNDTIANPNADCEFTLEDYTGRAQATDNCEEDGAVVFTQRPPAGTVIGGQSSVEEITITATDANGNTTTCTFELSLQDVIPPSIICPADQVQLVDDGCATILEDFTNLAVTDDNCSPSNVTVSQMPAPGTSFTGVQTQTITLTADDGNGNTAPCTFTVSIEDEIDPVLSCPATSVIPANAACEVAIVNYVDSVSVTDNCDAAMEISLTQDVSVGTTINGLGASLDVTITAEDQSGRTDQCVITVELIDTIRPEIICAPDADLEVDASCAAVLPDYRAAATATDNCNDPADVLLVQNPPAGTPLSTEGTTQEVTITATDASGNIISCDFTVTLIDTISPVVVCPNDDVISVDGTCEIAIPDYTTGAQPTDNCTDPAAIALSQSPAPGTLISGDGTVREITITATDASGNTSTCTLTVTLEDRTDPTITCPVDQELTADEDCEVPIPDYTGDASVSSVCDQGNGITITQDPIAGTLISGHNTMREITLTATDASGNDVSCSFNVTLIDRTAPTIVDCPTGPIVEQVDGSCEYILRDYWDTTPASANDNCTRTGATTTTGPGNQIIYTQTPAPFTVLTSGMGSQVITLTADDRNGNTTSCQFTVELQDTVAPVITVCPADTIANPDANCAFVIEDYTGRATATDNCEQDGAVVFAQTPVAGTVVREQGTVTPITITATDANGNTTTCTFELTLQDTISPSITCPVDQSDTLSMDCALTLLDYTSLAVVDDNCTDAAAITVTQVPAPGTVFTGVQTQEITLTADDGNGNTTSCTFTLNLLDEIDPELSCPAQSIIPADADCELDIVNYVDSVSVTDNCDLAAEISLMQDIAVGTTVNGLGGMQDITITATDQSGNTDFCVITVVLVDTISPVLTCVPDTVLGADENCAAILPDYRDVASATDNCNDAAGITFSQSPAPGTAYSDEATDVDVTITATDASGNATSCVFNVQLIDTIPPTVICPVNQIVEVDENCAISLLDYRDVATPGDNCSVDAAGEIELSQDPAPGTSFSGDMNSFTTTITATDQSGNQSTCTFTVTLDDVTPPVIQDCQTDTTGVVGADCTYTLPDYWALAPATAQDNCRPTGTTATTASGDQIIYTQSPPPGTVLQDAFTTQVVTLTADDQNGNTVSCDFLLTLSDTTSPSITCPQDTVANPDGDCNFVVEDYTGRAQIADNCTASTDLLVTQVPAIGTVLNGQATTQEITLTVTDPSGNETSCTFNLMLQDTTSPTIVCPQAKIENLDGACEFTVPDYTSEAISDDNCTDVASIMVTQLPAPGTVIENLNEGNMVTIILTADDGNGNTTSCDFTVTLDDVLDPVITCPADSTVFVDENCEVPLPDLVAVTSASDNCNPVAITQSPAAAQTFSGDDTEVLVTLTADDGNGNTSSCQVMITLQDTVPPSIVCPPNETLLTDPNCNVSLPDYTVAATVADNCTATTGIVVSQDIAAGTTFTGEGTTQVVTLTADDGNGNTATCSLEITVDDNTPPTIVCPQTQTQFVTAVCDVEIADYTGAAAVLDNCTEASSIVVTQDPASGTGFTGVQNTVVTLTADDGNGNTTSCQFTVRFEDNTVPTITCPAPQELDFGQDCQFTVPDLRGLALLDDNCTDDPITVTQTPEIASLIDGLGTVTAVTLTATDASANTSNCTFTLTTVSPTPPPPFTTVALAVIAPPIGTGLVNLEDALDPAAATNLSGVDLDRGQDAGPGPYDITYYLSVEDANAGANAIPAADFDPGVFGEAVAVRVEDPATGCFQVSQILIDVRVPGMSGAIDATSCSRPGTVIVIDGLPEPGGQGSTIVRHEWRLLDDGRTGIQATDLIDADQQVVSLATAPARRSGTVILQYQFFEDYGSGPVVPSVPKTISIEILQVGGGEFFWDGN